MAEAVLCAVCRVGAGLRPRPVFRGRGVCRGRPMCRPGHGSVAGPIHGRTHRSAPTRGGERSGTNGNRCRNGPRQRGGTEPAPYRRRSRPARPGRRGKGYGSNAGSAQQRADVPKAWLPPTKFRAEIWGVSHGHRPLRKGRKAAATALASGAERSVCGADVKDGWGSRQRSPPNIRQPRTIPQSRPLADSFCCGAQNSLLADRSQNFDRSHSLTSLHLPPAALGSLPLYTREPLALRGTGKGADLWSAPTRSSE